MGRAHLRVNTKDREGNVVQDALVQLLQVGTDDPITQDVFLVREEGEVVAPALISDANGVAEAWFDVAPGTIDVLVSDNDGAARYPDGGAPASWIPEPETVEVYRSPEDESGHASLEYDLGHLPPAMLEGAGVQSVTEADFNEAQPVGTVVFVKDTTTGYLYECTKVADGAWDTLCRMGRDNTANVGANQRWEWTGVQAYAGQAVNMVLPNDAVATFLGDDTHVTIQGIIDVAADGDGTITVITTGGGKNPLKRRFEYKDQWGRQPIAEPVVTLDSDDSPIVGYMDSTQLGVLPESETEFTATLPVYGDVSFSFPVGDWQTETVEGWQAIIDAAIGEPGVITLEASNGLSDFLDLAYGGALAGIDVPTVFVADPTGRYTGVIQRQGRNGTWSCVQYNGPKRKPIVLALNHAPALISGDNYLDFADAEVVRGSDWLALDETSGKVKITCPEGSPPGTYMALVSWEGLGGEDREILLSTAGGAPIAGDLFAVSGFAWKGKGNASDNGHQAMGLFELAAGRIIDVNLFWWDVNPAVLGHLSVVLIKWPEAFA